MIARKTQIAQIAAVNKLGRRLGKYVLPVSQRKLYCVYKYTHIRIDMGMVSNLNKFTSPPHGVAVGILWGQQIKSPGNVMNFREN